MNYLLFALSLNILNSAAFALISKYRAIAVKNLVRQTIRCIDKQADMMPKIIVTIPSIDSAIGFKLNMSFVLKLTR